jgi:hypothetical protein
LENLKLFDKILVLSKGEMDFYGTPNELFNHFQISSMLDLYQKFSKGSNLEQIQEAKKSAETYKNSYLYKKYHSKNSEKLELQLTQKNASTIQQILGYLHRQFLQFTSFKHSKIIDFFSSALFIQLLLQPILIAFILKLSCASYFYSGGLGDPKELFFFSALAVFWFGLNSSIRELVKERTPWRCLENLENINIKSYLFSKIIWSCIISIIQVSIFSFILYVIKPLPIENIDTINATQEPRIVFSIVFYLILLSVCFVGSFIGLAISAFFKKETPAVGLLPIVLIPILFFSHPIIKDTEFGYYPIRITNTLDENSNNNGLYNIYAIKLKRLMPCHEPQVFMEKYNNKEYKKEDIMRLLRNTLCYILLSITCMMYFQYRNEEKWEGR